MGLQQKRCRQTVPHPRHITDGNRARKISCKQIPCPNPDSFAGLFPHRITGTGKDPNHSILPDRIILLPVIFDAALPEFCQQSILGAECPYVFDPAGPPAAVIQDEQAPAPVVPADLRPCQVNGAVRELTSWLVPEKRAGIGQFCKNALIQEEFPFVGIYRYWRFFPGILVMD